MISDSINVELPWYPTIIIEFSRFNYVILGLKNIVLSF